MAANSKQTIIDQNVRYVVKFTGQGVEGPVGKIDASNLNLALDVTGQVKSNNQLSRQVYNLQLKEVRFAVSSSGNDESVTIYWEDTGGGANTPLVVLSGTDEWLFTGLGDSFNIPSNANTVTSNGNIGLFTTGFSANSTYTIILGFRKDGASYDQGQTARPQDFNAGNLTRTR